MAKCYLWITNLKILLNDEMISPLPLINYIYHSMKTEKEQWYLRSRNLLSYGKEKKKNSLSLLPWLSSAGSIIFFFLFLSFFFPSSFGCRVSLFQYEMLLTCKSTWFIFLTFSYTFIQNVLNLDLGDLIWWVNF